MQEIRCAAATLIFALPALPALPHKRVGVRGWLRSFGVDLGDVRSLHLALNSSFLVPRKPLRAT